MNRKNLSILITSTILSCWIGGFVVNPQKVEAKELEVEQKQNIKPEASSNNSEDKKPEVESKDIVKDTLEMLKETKTLYYTYYYKFDKNFKQEIKDLAESTYVYEKEIKNLQHNPEELEKYCKTNPQIIKLREVNKRLKEEVKKITDSKKTEEKKTDVSKAETPINPDTRKPQVKPEDKQPEVDVKQNKEKPDAKHDNKNIEKELNNKVIDNSKIKPNKNKQKDLNKDEVNKNIIKDQSKVMNSRESKAETKKFKDIPKTGEASNLPYIGGLLISLASFIKLNMKKFKKN